MKQKEERVECFVPAKALQHYKNKEDASLMDRLKMAIERYSEMGNFETPIPEGIRPAKVYIRAHSLDPENLGYNVWALLIRG